MILFFKECFGDSLGLDVDGNESFKYLFALLIPKLLVILVIALVPAFILHLGCVFYFLLMYQERFLSNCVEVVLVKVLDPNDLTVEHECLVLNQALSKIGARW